MNLIHLYTGPDGRSHFDDIELAVTSDAGGLLFQLGDAASGLAIRELVPGWTNDMHPAPRRALVLQLTGSGEIECGGGERRVVGPGDLLLVDDLTGEGHRSREVEGPRRQVYVYVDPDLDLETLRQT